MTNVLLPKSCDLEAVDQQAKYSLIQTFRLLKQFCGHQVVYFKEKNLGISNLHINLSYREPTIDLFCSLTGKTMFTSLTDYFSKQQLSVFNNDCQNFHKPKQQHHLISLIKYLLSKNDINQLILQNGLGWFPLS